ncbi:MAG: hypothetical protein HETSPECPRED_009032 [Heterodermia speciosa]|uniref:Uncharacterized protein n=1 Tax=Heterodermia speciosa TaxID=116794 RepID=A0A8H3IYF1_9LECA|nr:MAG: hypothetical protein HETSPECPRED_009032 [Heterodermia speciosa]
MPPAPYRYQTRADHIGFIFSNYGRPINSELVEILNAAIFLELAQKFRANPGLKNEPVGPMGFTASKDGLRFAVEPRLNPPPMLWKELYAILPDISSWAIRFQVVEVEFSLWRPGVPGFTELMGRVFFRLMP